MRKLKPGDTSSTPVDWQTQARQRQPISAWAALHLNQDNIDKFDF